MALSQARSKRKSTGGRYKDFRKKRHHNMSGLPSLTRLEERRVKVLRARGGNLKRRLLSTNIANIYDSSKVTSRPGQDGIVNAILVK